MKIKCMIVKICFIAHCSFSIVFSQVNNVGGGQAPGQIVEEGGEEEFYQPDQSQIGVGSPVAGQASGGSMVAQAPPSQYVWNNGANGNYGFGYYPTNCIYNYIPPYCCPYLFPPFTTMLQTLTPNDLLYLMNALRGYTTYPALMSSIQQNPALLSSFNMLGNFFSQLPMGIQQLANGLLYGLGNILGNGMLAYAGLNPNSQQFIGQYYPGLNTFMQGPGIQALTNALINAGPTQPQPINLPNGQQSNPNPLQPFNPGQNINPINPLSGQNINPVNPLSGQNINPINPLSGQNVFPVNPLNNNGLNPVNTVFEEGGEEMGFGQNPLGPQGAQSNLAGPAAINSGLPNNAQVPAPNSQLLGQNPLNTGQLNSNSFFPGPQPLVGNSPNVLANQPNSGIQPNSPQNALQPNSPQSQPNGILGNLANMAQQSLGQVGNALTGG